VVVGVVAARTHLLVEVGGRGRDLLVAEPVPQPRQGGLLVDFGPKAAGVGLERSVVCLQLSFSGWIGLIVLPLLKRLVAHVLWLTGAACALYRRQ
jgi:hypothetical protein